MKIKRYDLVDDNSTVIPDRYMVEKHDREWIKYEDLEKYILIRNLKK